MADINKVIKRPEYDFIWTNEHLKDRIMFLTFGGSRAYGTETEHSDIDVRGCVAVSKDELLGIKHFEQFVDNGTDTTIYAFPRIIQLLISCNPNVIEMLGCRPETYAMLSKEGKMLLDNKKLFLSKRCVASFGGYARQQLRRLESAVAQRSPSADEKEQHVLKACESAIEHFCERYAQIPEGGIKLRIGDGNTEPDEIVMDISLHGYPLRDYRSMWREMNDIARNFGKIDNRNRKKDDAHLNKHMMHLVRLYSMCIDILEKEDIVTFRKDDHNMLMSIRNGEYVKNGKVLPEFYEMLDELQKEFEYAKEYTNLPEQPDSEKINDLAISINEMAIREERERKEILQQGRTISASRYLDENIR